MPQADNASAVYLSICTLSHLNSSSRTHRMAYSASNYCWELECNQQEKMQVRDSAHSTSTFHLQSHTAFRVTHSCLEISWNYTFVPGDLIESIHVWRSPGIIHSCLVISLNPFMPGDLLELYIRAW